MPIQQSQIDIELELTLNSENQTQIIWNTSFLGFKYTSTNHKNLF